MCHNQELYSINIIILLFLVPFSHVLSVEIWRSRKLSTVFGYKKHEELIGLLEHKENTYIGR